MGFWDLFQYALTVQLILVVATHIRRIVRPASLFSVLLCYLMSVSCHLLNLSFVGYFSSTGSTTTTTSSRTKGNNSINGEKVEMIFALSSFSISLLALSFLLLIYFVEAAMWLRTSFLPLLKSVKVFYTKKQPQSQNLIPLPNVVAPGIDLRGKVLQNQGSE